MAAEDTPAARSTLATVVATAAVTLALGVTAAALGGYLTPQRAAAPSADEVASAPADAGTAPPAVVLVPVRPEATVPTAAPADTTALALAEGEVRGGHDDDEDDDDERHGHGRHHDDD